MGYLGTVTVPKSSTGGFLKSVTPPAKGFVPAPPSTPAPAPKNLAEQAVDYIKSTIAEQFKSGVGEIKSGLTPLPPGGNLITRQPGALKGALDVGEGVVTAATSFLAPVLHPLGSAIQTSGEGYATLPIVKNFANSPAGDVAYNTAKYTGKIANVLGGILGGVESLRGRGVSSETIGAETPKPEPTFLQSVKPAEAPTVEEPSISHAQQEIENTKGQIGVYQDVIANDPAKELLKFYGKNDPRYSNLDDIFSRNVGNKKSGSLDTKVTELGFNDVQEAHNAVLSYLDTKESLLQAKAHLRTLQDQAKNPAPLGSVASKVGVSIEQNAIEKGLTESFNGTAGYDPITIKEQAQLVSDLIARDPLSARRMALGEEPIPENIKASALLIGLEDHAVQLGDTAFLKDLARSPLTSETSAHAQELRLLAERTPESPVGIIRDITKARVASVERRVGTIRKATQSTVSQIKSEIRKVNTKQTWGDFVKSIECNY